MRTDKIQTFVPWTPEEEKTLAELMARGAPMSEKIEALPRRTVDAIKRRQDRIRKPDSPSNKSGKKPSSGNPIGRPPKNSRLDALLEEAELFREKKYTQRKCMTCGVEFASEGPHNRLCPNHRTVSASVEYSVRFR